MATILTQMPNAFCPEHCRKYDPEIEIVKFTADFTIVERHIHLTCKHEEACKLWNNEQYDADQRMKYGG